LGRCGGQYFVRHGKSSKGLKINKLVEFDLWDHFGKNLAEYFYLLNFKRKSLCFYAISSKSPPPRAEDVTEPTMSEAPNTSQP
jgi:hypothetical protein